MKNEIAKMQKLLKELGSLGFQNTPQYWAMNAPIINQIQMKCIELYPRTLIHEVIKQKEEKQPELQRFATESNTNRKIALFSEF